MTRYSNETTATNGTGRNVDKWIALELMQRVEQVNNLSGILSATMEDLSDQLTNVESELENLSETTETLQEKIEEISERIVEAIYQLPIGSKIGKYLTPRGSRD